MKLSIFHHARTEFTVYHTGNDEENTEWVAILCVFRHRHTDSWRTVCLMIISIFMRHNAYPRKQLRFYFDWTDRRKFPHLLPFFIAHELSLSNDAFQSSPLSIKVFNYHKSVSFNQSPQSPSINSTHLIFFQLANLIHLIVTK